MKPSRRRFLQTTMSGPLVASLGRCALHQTVQGSASRMFAALLVVPGQGQFENPHIIRYDSSCFTIDGRDTLIRSATFHYPRCPKALWRDRLGKFQQAGFNTIETNVFWNFHEPEEGKANLADFEDFIKLVKETGFWMIVRPGPYVCGEWERGGFPSWVAAKRFPLRSNHPESLATSQHWYNLVLPIVQRHQITVGGPIIMLQVENEYDYSPPMQDADKREYIRALANFAWSAGIDVPIITCWTKQARENSDPEMARIIDTCNFHPRWDVVKGVVPALEKLRKEEPASPLGVTELQGGWFSQFGGKLSVDQDGVSGAQLNLLTKTVLEQGVTYFNYYMGFGGTNFDWAAKNLTTTYDYAAPIREPGGLWEKYYAARGICQSLRVVGEMLARAQRVTAGVECTNANVSVTERAFVKSGVVFVRENANTEQRFKMTFIDPNSPTHRRIDVPREGELALGARCMKLLPVQVPVAGGRLCYSTAEVLAHGRNLDRSFLVLYDEPGQLVEIGLATENEPRVEGDTVYQYWDREYDSAIIGVRVEKQEKMLRFNEYLLVIIVPRDRALHSWVPEFPSRVVLGAEETRPMDVPFLSDIYQLAGSGSRGHRLWVDLDFLPGEHDLTVLLPPQPSKCRLDGVETDFQYAREWRRARVHLTTPPLPVQPIVLSEVGAWVERFGGQHGVSPASVGPTPLGPLEAFGPAPYGYVKFLASQFSYNGQPKMFITAFANDEKKVFLNDKLVVEASNSSKQAQCDLAPYARPGANNLQICYESFGAQYFGEELGELKGIESVKVGSDSETATAVNPWQIQRFPPGMKDRTIDPEFSIGGWQPASLRGIGTELQPSASAKELIPAFTWCRAEFAVPGPPEGWTIPWRLVFEADRDALLYLNGKFLGRYVTVGPQKEFYLPEPYLGFESKRNNVLTVVLAYTDQPSHIRTLRLAPYVEYSVRRTQVEFQW